MTLYDKTDDWYRDARWHSVSQILEDIKSSCIDEGFDEDAVEEFMDDNRDDIVNIIYERDDSDALGGLLKNTDDIPVRVEMLSNYDCINSHWLESQGGYVYPDSYFGDMVDALNLNPAKVKRFLAEKGLPCMAGAITGSHVTVRNWYHTRISIESLSTHAAGPIC